MKRVFCLINLSMVLLFASCSDNDSESAPETAAYSPRAQAAKGQ